MQNLNTRPATRKVGQSTEIVKLLRIQASDTHVVEFDNVDSGKIFYGTDICDSVADSLAKYLADIGSRIGTHQKRSLTLIGQPYRSSTCQGCFTHTTFASEEDERGNVF